MSSECIQIAFPPLGVLPVQQTVQAASKIQFNGYLLYIFIATIFNIFVTFL